MINPMPAMRLIKELGEGKHLEIDNPELEEDIWKLFLFDDYKKLDRDELYKGHLSLPSAHYFFVAHFDYEQWTWELEIIREARQPLTLYEKEAVAA